MRLKSTYMPCAALFFHHHHHHHHLCVCIILKVYIIVLNSNTSKSGKYKIYTNKKNRAKNKQIKWKEKSKQTTKENVLKALFFFTSTFECRLCIHKTLLIKENLEHKKSERIYLYINFFVLFS